MKLPPVATKRSKNLARLAPFGAAVPRCSDRVPARNRAVRSEALRIAMKADQGANFKPYALRAAHIGEHRFRA